MKELTEDEKKAKEFIVTQVVNALDLMEKHFKKYCDEVSPAYLGTKSTAVPMVYISESVRQFKESYVKSANSVEVLEEEKTK